MDLGFNFDPFGLFKKKLKLFLISGGAGCYLGIVMLAVIVWQFIAPIDAVINFAEETASFFSKAWNLITLGHFTSEEQAWYAELNDQYNKYAGDGIYIDRALIASALFYDQPMDSNEDYVEKIDEESLDKYQTTEDLDKAVEDGEFGSSKELNYRLLVSEARILAKAFADGENGSAKTDDEIREYLQKEFAPYKLFTLGIRVPDDENGKEKVTKEFVNFVYLKRDVYADLFEKESGQCEFTQNPDTGATQPARITSYTGDWFGGTIDSIPENVKRGYFYYDENDFGMWKGGSPALSCSKDKKTKKMVCKETSTTYGESGTEYLVVAMASKKLDGMKFYSKALKRNCEYHSYDDIQMFTYGDTFTVTIDTPKGGKKTYSAINLDSCGACMDFSPSAAADDRCYAPKSSLEKKRVQETKNLKIDVYKKDGAKSPGDMGTYTPGTSSGVCIGTIDLGALVPGNKGTNVVNKPIKEIIGEEGVQELNNQIKANVEKYGKGTGNAAAAAAITLINGLKQKGYRLPYLYGGGHNSGEPANGIDLKWGRNDYQTDSKGRSLYSYDCSGFVSWALYQAGCPKNSSTTSSMISGKPVKRIKNIKDAKPGDIVNDPGSHVVMVVQNNGGDITFAESTTRGIIFTKPGSGFEGSRDITGYDIWDMSEYYKQYCQH